MRKLAETSFPVTADTVARALAWLDATGERQQWPTRTTFKLRLCLDETLTNVVMHGYSGAAAVATPCVRLRLHQEGRRLVLELLDNGVAFDPTAQASRELDASLDDAQIGGHGLRLLRHYLEDIRYERCEGWNRLRLITVLDDA